MKNFFLKTGSNDYEIKISDIVDQNGGVMTFGYIDKMRSANIRISVRPPVKDIKIGNKKRWVDAESNDEETVINYNHHELYDVNKGYFGFLCGKIYVDQKSDFEVSILFVETNGALKLNEKRNFTFAPASDTLCNGNEQDEITSVPELQCIVCGKNKIQMMYKNCNHFCICFNCRYSVKKCPICDKNSECIKIYLP